MRSSALRATVLTAVVAAVACSDSTVSPATAEAELNADVAFLSADAVAEDLEVMSTVFPAGSGSAPAAAGILDFSRSRTVEFFDTDGVEQDSYDALTTASIHTTLTVEGQAARDGFDWSLSRSRDMTVTGLEGVETQRTWNGTGEETGSRARVTVGGETRTYDLNGTLLVEDVVRGVPRASNPYPLSGTITRNVTVEVTNGPRGDETITRLVVVTFNGTRYADLTVNDESFQLDLDATGRARVRHPTG
jgi:hypothetical protein